MVVEGGKETRYDRIRLTSAVRQKQAKKDQIKTTTSHMPRPPRTTSTSTSSKMDYWPDIRNVKRSQEDEEKKDPKDKGEAAGKQAPKGKGKGEWQQMTRGNISGIIVKKKK